MNIEKVIHSRLFVIILIVILIFMVIITGTYAWFTWNSTENTELTMTIGKLADVTFTSGNDINTGLTPVYNYYDGEKTTFSINNRNNSGDMAIYKINFNITSIDTELISDQVKYVLVKNGDLIRKGNLSNISSGSTIELETATMATGITSYEFYLYLDGNEENDRAMIGKTIVGNIMLEGSESSNVLVEHLSNLYSSSSKNVVTNNNIEYNYATSASLMNDRLGGTTSDYNAGNIRYYGASPNNYIDIGDVYKEDTTFNNWEFKDLNYDNTEACYEDWDCDTYYADWGYDTVEACYGNYGISSVEEICGTTTYTKGTPILYRIIGLFKDVQLADDSKKDLIKVIRAESIGKYSWDTSDSSVNGGKGINEWSQADLMKLLNPGYESETVGGSLWWNSGSGTCYNFMSNATTSCDFTVSGLSSNVQNKIASVVWNTGGWDDSSVYSNQIYGYERGTNVAVPGTTCSGTYCNDSVTRTTEWTGKVALMYPSDYGYATDFNNCNSYLRQYYTDGCYNNDWLYNNVYQWLLTPSSGIASDAWFVASIGYVHSDYRVFSAHGVRPVLYLSSEATINSGDGSEGNPYKLSVS